MSAVTSLISPEQRIVTATALYAGGAQRVDGFAYGEVPGEHVTRVEKVEAVASARQAAVGAHDGGVGHDVALAVIAVCSMGAENRLRAQADPPAIGSYPLG